MNILIAIVCIAYAFQLLDLADSVEAGNIKTKFEFIFKLIPLSFLITWFVFFCNLE